MVVAKYVNARAQVMSYSEQICNKPGNYIASNDNGYLDQVYTWIPFGFHFPRLAGIKVMWVFINSNENESNVILLEK